MQYNNPLNSIRTSWHTRQEQMKKEVALVEQDLRHRAQTLLLTLLQARTDSLKLLEEVAKLQQRAETFSQQEDVATAKQIYLHIIDLYEHEHHRRNTGYYTEQDLPLIGATLNAARFLAQRLLLQDAAELGQKALHLCEHMYDYERINFGTLVYYDYAEEAVQRGEITKAEIYFEKLLRVFAKHYGAEDPRIAIVLCAQAYFAMQSKHDLQLAERLFLEALELRESWFEQGHPSVVATWLLLAIVYLWQQRYEDARQALHHTDQLCSMRLIIIDTAALQQEVDNMMNLSSRRRILNAGAGILGTAQQKLQIAQQNLVTQIQDPAGKRLSEAETYVRHLQDKKDKPHQENNTQEEDRPGLQHLSIVSQLQFHEKYTEAEALAQQILQNTKEAYGPHHMMVATVFNSLARLYQQQAKYEEAVQCYQQALSIYEDLYGPEHSHAENTMSLLVSALLDMNNDEDAAKINQRLLALAEKNKQHNQTPNPLHLRNMARICLKQERYEEAEHYAHQLLYHLEQKWGPQHIALCEALGILTRTVLLQQRYAEADLFYQRALAISGTRTANEAPATRHAMEQWESKLKHDYRTDLHRLQQR